MEDSDSRFKVVPLCHQGLSSFVHSAPRRRLCYDLSLCFMFFLQHSSRNVVSSLVLFRHQAYSSVVSNLSCFHWKGRFGKKMEARSGARIKGIFGWIIKKIAACWNATRSSLWSVALFKNKRAPRSPLHEEERVKLCSLKWCQAQTSGFRAALCHCPWCWINVAIQRPWNRLLELQF